MTVERATALVKEYYSRETHILLDARDVLDILDGILEMFKHEEQENGRSHSAECDAIEFAIHTIEQMNIIAPYYVKVLNEKGGIDVYVPESPFGDSWDD